VLSREEAGRGARSAGRYFLIGIAVPVIAVRVIRMIIPIAVPGMVPIIWSIIPIAVPVVPMAPLAVWTALPVPVHRLDRRLLARHPGEFIELWRGG
jgi:hypothetical protein